MTGAQTFAEYNAIDSAVTFKCFEKLFEEMHETGYTDIVNQTNDLCEVLLYMQSRGLLIDKDNLREMQKKILAEISEYQAELNEVCGFELNVASPKQCVQYFYGILGLSPYTSNKGKPTTDDKALARIARKNKKGSVEARLVQKVRNLRKLEGTYLSIELDPDGRMRCSCNPRGTWTGRISTSQTIFKRGGNLQNIDPRFKSFIVADPGYIMVEIDKAQAEWVVTAYLSGDADMMMVIEEGLDAHVYTGHKISKLPLDIVERESKIVGHTTDPYEIERLRRADLPELFDGTYPNAFLPRIFSIRQAGKKSNHALNYKEGYKRFALENEMEERDAKPIVEGYRASYPGLTNYWDEVFRKLEKDRTLTNCFGRKCRFLGMLDHETHKKAISFVPQSTVGDLVNRGLIDIYRQRQQPMYDLDLLTQVHDSVLLQFPINRWDDMAAALLECKRALDPTLEYRNRQFHIGTDIKVGLNWGLFGDDNRQGMMELPFPDDIRELSEVLESRYAQATK